MEDNLTGENFIGRQSHWKINSLKMISQENNSRERQLHRKTIKTKHSKVVTRVNSKSNEN